MSEATKTLTHVFNKGYQRFRKYVLAPPVFLLMDLVGFKRHLPYTCTGDDAQRLIRDKLLLDRPCMIGRIGGTEIRNIEGVLHKNGNWTQKLKWLLTFNQPWPSKKLQRVWLRNENNPDDAFFERFTQLMMNDLDQLDVFAAWRWEEFEIFKEPYRFDVISLDDLEPFFSATPWTSALRGKKVLVIQPFVEEIGSQYRRREKLFRNPDILPEFDLRTYMPFYLDLRDYPKDWFARLECMKREIAEIDFDIALIAAGGYGFPLAAHIKRLGRKAVVVGGVLQMLFGIKGSRWDAMPAYRGLYNEYWIRPGEKSRPQGFHKIEGGCYW